MGNLTHYPDIKRWWRPQRCICGLRLRNCPDWRAFLAGLRVTVQLGQRLDLRP